MEQAEAAGVAEGFLTFPLILPHYEARVHRALCLPHPQFCQFCRRVFQQQLELVESMVERWGSQASYYKMVGLFYSQLEGLRLGLELRQSADSPALSSSLDPAWFAHFLNFYPELPELAASFRSQQGEEAGPEISRHSGDL